MKGISLPPLKWRTHTFRSLSGSRTGGFWDSGSRGRSSSFELYPLASLSLPRPSHGAWTQSLLLWCSCDPKWHGGSNWPAITLVAQLLARPTPVWAHGSWGLPINKQLAGHQRPPFGPLEETDQKCLSLKTAFLLAVTSAIPVGWATVCSHWGLGAGGGSTSGGLVR